MWLLWGWKAKKSAILRFVLILQSQIFQHGAENFEVFKFQSQKCYWFKFKSRHGCYNPWRIICNHLKLWICWDAQEIKRFSISFGGDIFFATGVSWSQQQTLSRNGLCCCYSSVNDEKSQFSRQKKFSNANFWKIWKSTPQIFFPNAFKHQKRKLNQGLTLVTSFIT